MDNNKIKIFWIPIFIILVGFSIFLFSFDFRIFLEKNFSAIIALCALLLTVIQLHWGMYHNRLSVRPALNTSTHVHAAPNQYSVIITLSNYGIGTAIIDNFSVYFDDELISLNDPQTCEDAILELVNNKFPITSHRIFTYRSGGTIPANFQHSLLELTFNNELSKDLDKIKSEIPKLLDRLSLEIEYSSFYNEKFTMHSD